LKALIGFFATQEAAIPAEEEDPLSPFIQHNAIWFDYHQLIAHSSTPKPSHFVPYMDISVVEQTAIFYEFCVDLS